MIKGPLQNSGVILTHGAIGANLSPGFSYVVVDSYGIELLHPIREGRSPAQLGRKGKSNHRWIIGGKLCLLVTQFGLVAGWV
jgi:hypothetical protein